MTNDPIEVLLTGAADEADARELWPVYAAVFGDHDSEAGWYDQVWSKHVNRDGFGLARAYERGRLVGFAYGYTGLRGQWWTDRVAETLPADVADPWLGDHFELVSIGVLTSARRHGTGRRLLCTITGSRPESRWLLQTTEDEHDPARRLYASEGWHVLGPGATRGTVVMGRPAAPHSCGGRGE